MGLDRRYISTSWRNGLVGLALTVLLGGCQSQQDSSYFPLQPGYRWVYQVTESGPDLPEKQIRRFEIQTLEPQSNTRFVELTDETQVFIRRTSDGTSYYYSRDDSGVYQLGKRNLIEKQPAVFAEPRLVMPPLDDLTNGYNWTLATRPYRIHSTRSHVAWNRALNGFDMTYELAGSDMTITTPAGRFEHCILLEGRAQVGLYADPRLGYQEVEVVQREWYAAGVGLVRFERDEPLDLEMFKGGSVRFELIALDRP
ncbi:hypothetical protein [Oceanobacter mangrovi]|uniref:hypothetical protein n=1 Tax=Oceanobacter mangrovi TaxID=2862510 RepID=UPI001C8D5CE9|nr:hypothetical protein [Oceanobacter mangrovi]